MKITLRVVIEVTADGVPPISVTKGGETDSPSLLEVLREVDDGKGAAMLQTAANMAAKDAAREAIAKMRQAGIV